MAKQPIPNAPTTCLLYARVSTTEQRDEGYSLDAQLALLREYAAEKSLVIQGEFLDSESGSKSGRTSFGKMISQIEQSDSPLVIICEKTDRLYRNFADMVKIDELAVELHFVKENIVIGPDSRSNDKFIHTIKVCLAKHFSDNLREEVKKGMTEKARQGIFPSVAPVGYINTTDGHRKVIEPDPEMAPLVTQIFDQYASGSLSIEDATKFAKSIGLRTRKGRSFARSSIARMLDNPVYIGIVRWNDEEYPGIHDPIVDVATFQEVQKIMHGRTSNTGFGKHEFSYRGILTCAHCGCSITAEIKKGKYVYYRCTGMRDKSCPGMKVIREEKLTDQFAGLLEGLVLSPENLESLKIALRESLADEAEMRRSNMERIASESAKIRASLEQMYLDRLADRISEDTYESLRKKLSHQLTYLSVQTTALDKTEASYYDLGLRILELSQSAPLRFKLADSETKHKILLELLESATLDCGNVQVSMREPFQTLFKQNIERVGNEGKNAKNEDWYSGRDSNPRPSP
jgi:site-specific DNA recombinase